MSSTASPMTPPAIASSSRASTGRRSTRSSSRTRPRPPRRTDFMRRLLLPLALLVAACSAGEAEGPAAEETKFQRDLTDATAKARAKLPYFWEHFAAPQLDEFDFSVKAALPRRDGQPGAEEV